ncbi:hypothetical protein WJX72_006614 [[Myrmecia] bisecta]|uniref:Triosephosphate isomerase n=1 Tax=[Myrmecia] bisecta TaxID=41462 RepID=A0AAW1R7P4_9CHLO
MPRTFFVGGNWKCNGTAQSVSALVDTLNNADLPAAGIVEVVVAPTYVHIPLVQQKLRFEIAVSAQNCWVKGNGAYTGEVSADILVDLGLHWVILGHSERRSLLQESNEFVADKTVYALSKGLNVILCVGETLAQRENGDTMNIVNDQIKAVADKLSPSDWTKVVVAYEPVWAIGTGKVATTEQAQEVHQQLRSWLSDNVSADVGAQTRIIYGGSVSAKNCNELAGAPDIDGFLVGGASLKPEFVDIIASAKNRASA